MKWFSVEFLITIGTAIGGIFAFLRGTAEYRKNNRIKRAEFLDKLIKEFTEPEIDIARNMLDDYVYVEIENREKSLPEQKKLAKPLFVYLRNHNEEPIVTKGEIAVRKSFDTLLDFFTRLSYYYKQELIDPAELSFFRYYLEKLEEKQEVINYIKIYYYIVDFNPLFEARKKLI